jgi:predicted membrane protein
VLHVDLPLVRVAFGLLFVWTGLSLLSQPFGLSIPAPLAWDDHTMILSHGEVDVDADRELNVIFANGTIDLRTVPVSNPPRAVEINTVFGSATILYDASVPLYVDASSAFGVVELPNHETVTFGDRTWRSTDYDAARPGIAVKVSSVFGACRFAAAGEARAPAGTKVPAQ